MEFPEPSCPYSGSPIPPRNAAGPSGLSIAYFLEFLRGVRVFSNFLGGSVFSPIFEGGPCFLENLRGGSVFSKVYEGVRVFVKVRGPCFLRVQGPVRVLVIQYACKNDHISFFHQP